ncbi:MAG: LLM class F420-dependent oxidoreductase [Pseudomonadota bacterium]|nr:LLM class F420-dependent oxidoreductase [Pseudomonadota bacterium]MED5554747.1 LLM class F420-dependent oxidoreductase [Pseudomonadota bacterium]
MTDIGIFYFATEYGHNVVDVARDAEQRGFESLWLPEHTHIPVSRKTPYAGGAELPKEYAHTLDPFVALAAVATATKHIRLATGISLLIERDTITMAKTLATLDLLSNGRAILGVGGGWNREEAEHHGVEWSQRFQKLEEQITAIKIIWANDEASFHGEHVRFDPIWSWPKPIQRPRPPILLGGETDHTLRRVIKYCDGWLPRARDPEIIVRGIARLNELAEEAGRDTESISVNVFAPRPDAELIDRFKSMGVARIVLWLPPEDSDAVSQRLDGYTRFL